MTPAHLRTLAVTAPLRGYSYARCVCTELTAAVVEALHGPLSVEAERALNITDLRYPWSPIEAVALHIAQDGAHAHAAGPHLPGPEQMQPGRVYLCQGWDGLVDGRIVAASRGHAWLWLADTAGTGWCLESSYGPRREDPRGPRLWCADGRIPLADALDVEGRPTRAWSPMWWHWRGGTWDAVAWVEV
jgi:hypothetical protein